MMTIYEMSTGDFSSVATKFKGDAFFSVALHGSVHFCICLFLLFFIKPPSLVPGAFLGGGQRASGLWFRNEHVHHWYPKHSLPHFGENVPSQHCLQCFCSACAQVSETPSQCLQSSVPSTGTIVFPVPGILLSHYLHLFLCTDGVTEVE